MTRPRTPLSIDAAIARVMAQLGGWPKVAEVTGYKPRTCEKWGAFDIAEPDDIDARDIPARAIVKLDIAYQAGGGIGAPITEAIADMVKCAAAQAFGDKQELLTDTIDLIREGNDAEIALLEATQPEAGEAELVIAQRETLQLRRKTDTALVRLAAMLRRKKPP